MKDVTILSLALVLCVGIYTYGSFAEVAVQQIAKNDLNAIASAMNNQNERLKKVESNPRLK